MEAGLNYFHFVADNLNTSLPSMSSTIMAILPPTSPTTCIAGFSLAASCGRTTPDECTKTYLKC